MTTINLQPFVLPSVTKLNVRPVGGPLLKTVEGVAMTFQPIYYELLDTNGTIREAANVDIPFSIYTRIAEFVSGEVSEETLGIINAFFQQAGWDNMVAINQSI